MHEIWIHYESPLLLFIPLNYTQIIWILGCPKSAIGCPKDTRTPLWLKACYMFDVYHCFVSSLYHCDYILRLFAQIVFQHYQIQLHNVIYKYHQHSFFCLHWISQIFFVSDDNYNYNYNYIYNQPPLFCLQPVLQDVKHRVKLLRLPSHQGGIHTIITLI